MGTLPFIGEPATEIGAGDMRTIAAEESFSMKLERVREYLRTSPIEIPKLAKAVHLTFSGGVASTPADGVTADALISRADERLMAAKNGDRDRVIGTVSR